MHGEVEGMGKEAVVSSFKVASRYSPVDTEESEGSQTGRDPGAGCLIGTIKGLISWCVPVVLVVKCTIFRSNE
jgi:hypothetical protein